MKGNVIGRSNQLSEEDAQVVQDNIQVPEEPRIHSKVVSYLWALFKNIYLLINLNIL